MTPDQLQTFLDHNRRDTTEVVERVVNGKIRELKSLVEKYNEKHETDMADIKPIILEYKERQAMKAYAKRYGDGIKWTAAVITAFGILWVAFKSIIK